MLHPLCPQSATSVSDRVSIMQTIAKGEPMVAWKVVIESVGVGVGGVFASSIHRPEIVGWPLPPPAMPHAKLCFQNDFIVTHRRFAPPEGFA